MRTTPLLNRRSRRIFRWRMTWQRRLWFIGGAVVVGLGGLLSLKVAFGKMVLTVVGLLSGASIDRDRPSVQVGASLMYPLSRSRAVPLESMQRGLILAGGAAGVAAAFNAPLAGIVFVIVLEMTQNGELALPLIAATLIAHAVSRTGCRRPLYKALATGFKSSRRCRS